MRMRAGAAALDAAVARAAADAGIAGLEFLRGVPGTIGGALRMNAGCYGRELKDVLGRSHRARRPGQCPHPHRRRDGLQPIAIPTVPEDWIFVEAVFEGTADASEAVRARMNELVAATRGDPARTLEDRRFHLQEPAPATRPGN